VTLAGIDLREYASAAHRVRERVAVVGATGPELKTPVESPAVRGAAAQQATGVLEPAGHETECAGRHRAKTVRTSSEQQGCDD
jgi:hypothetical protein